MKKALSFIGFGLIALAAVLALIEAALAGIVPFVLVAITVGLICLLASI